MLNIMQYLDGVLQNCTLETYITLLTNVTPINLRKIYFKKEKKIGKEKNFSVTLKS